MNKIRKTILLSTLFLSANLILIYIHLIVFKSSYPFAAWVTVIIHFIALVMVPYEKFNPFKTTNKNNQNENQK